MKSDTYKADGAESPLSMEVRGGSVYHRVSGMVVHHAKDHTVALQWASDLHKWTRMKISILLDSDRRPWTIRDLSKYVGASDPMIRVNLSRLVEAGEITEKSAVWLQGKPKVYSRVVSLEKVLDVPPPYNMWDDPRTFGGEVPADVMDKWVSMHGDDPAKWPGPGDKKDG